MEAFGEQRFALYETGGQFEILCVSGRIAPISLFKGQGIGCYDDIAPFGKFRSVCLISIALQTNNFALSQMKLARMLMVSKDSRYSSVDMLGHQHKALYALICLHSILDGLSHI